MWKKWLASRKKTGIAQTCRLLNTRPRKKIALQAAFQEYKNDGSLSAALICQKIDAKQISYCENNKPLHTTLYKVNSRS